jgi:probable HAF family extracellular repeat protein
LLGFSRGLGLNNSGWAAGYSTLAFIPFGQPHVIHAVLWKAGGQLIDLGTLSGDSASFATAVSDEGLTVGYSTAGLGYDLNTLLPCFDPFAPGTSGNCTSDSARAFVRSDAAGMQALPGLGGTRSVAYGINNSGDIVGMSTAPGAPHAFLFSYAGGAGAATADLNALLATPLSAVLSEAVGINAGGTIVANGTDGHIYLLTPIIQ